MFKEQKWNQKALKTTFKFQVSRKQKTGNFQAPVMNTPVRSFFECYSFLHLDYNWFDVRSV